MSTSSNYAIALFGAGRIGRVHADNIDRHPSTQIKYIVDPFGSGAAELSEKYHCSAVDEDTVFSDDSIDAIVICSATETHGDLIERGMNNGKAVFCEKPIDLSIQRVDSVLKATSDSKSPLLLGFNRRFDPGIASMEKRIRAGDIGDVELVTVISKDPSPPPAEYIRVSGGLFRDMTVHDFDLARFMLDEEPITVHATAAALVDPMIKSEGDIDTAIVTLQCASGKMAVVTNSRRATFGYDQRIEVHGSLGSLRTNNIPETALVLEREEGVRHEKPMHFFLERYRDAYQVEWAHFVDVLDGKCQPSVSGEDGRRALMIADAAYASLESGARVSIDT